MASSGRSEQLRRQWTKEEEIISDVLHSSSLTGLVTPPVEVFHLSSGEFLLFFSKFMAVKYVKLASLQMQHQKTQLRLERQPPKVRFSNVN